MSTAFEAATIIFDLDGTLVDSVPGLALAIDRTCVDLDLPKRGQHRVREWVGHGLKALIGRALANGPEPVRDENAIADAMERFLKHYADCCCSASRPYPGVDHTLNTLRNRGHRLALATNKPAEFTEAILEHLGWDDRFELVLSFDSLPHAKPHPLPLTHAIDRLGGPALMVGDSQTDVQAARSADIPVIVTSYGYNHGDPIQNAGPDLVIDTMDELLLHVVTTNEGRLNKKLEKTP